ncbi:hypothetical protein D3C81_1882150 [compost metagenome]
MAPRTTGRIRQPDEEVVLVQLLGHSQVPAQQVHQRVAGQQVGAVVEGTEQHFHPGCQQEHPEGVENPLEMVEQRRAQADHQRPQHDHAENAPEQHIVLVAAGNAEEGENHRHDEHIVHRQ